MRNSTAYPQALRKKTPVVRAAAATHISEPPMQTGMMETSGETQGLQTAKLSVKQRQEKLFKELDLSELESWPPELVDLPSLSWLNTMMSLPWIPVNMAVLIQLNM